MLLLKSQQIFTSCKITVIIALIKPHQKCQSTLFTHMRINKSQKYILHENHSLSISFHSVWASP